MFLKKTKKGYSDEYYKGIDQGEYYRQLRTNIEFSSVHKKIKTLCITSSHIDEGKTVTSSNLAMISATKYDKVLLIDCDLRKPSIHRVFKISNTKGLSNLLLEEKYSIDDNTYFKKFKQSKGGGDLYVLPAGIKVPNPQEILSSRKFIETIESLKKEFAFIIFDCPPLLSVSDAIPVSNACDGTLLVISAADTNKKDAKLALTHLQRNGANVIGCVLNKVENESSSYYYNEY